MSAGSDSVIFLIWNFSLEDCRGVVPRKKPYIEMDYFISFRIFTALTQIILLLCIGIHYSDGKIIFMVFRQRSL